MTTDFIRLQSIIPDYKSLVGTDSLDADTYGGISENDILKWGHDAIGLISTAVQKVHKIVAIPIDQYRGKLPKGFLAVIQAAYRIGDHHNRCSREQIVQWTQDVFDKNGCQIKIDLECPGCSKVDCSCDQPGVEVDINRIYQDAHPEYYYGYMRHFWGYGNTFNREQGCVYTDQFRLMRRTSNEFYNIPYHIGECVNFKCESAVEYDIDFSGTELYMSTTFKKGEVLLSYMSEKTDPHGYRMVPDTSKSIEAVLTYIDERMAYRDWRKTRDAQRRVDWTILEQLRSKRIGQALAELKMPDKDKWKNFLETHWKQSIPFWSYNASRNLYDPNATDNGYYWAGVRKDMNFNY